MRVAVVGGSLGGLSAALTLRLETNGAAVVDVFERSTFELDADPQEGLAGGGRGAGLGLQPEMEMHLVMQDRLWTVDVMVGRAQA